MHPPIADAGIARRYGMRHEPGILPRRFGMSREEGVELLLPVAMVFKNSTNSSGVFTKNKGAEMVTISVLAPLRRSNLTASPRTLS